MRRGADTATATASNHFRLTVDGRMVERDCIEETGVRMEPLKSEGGKENDENSIDKLEEKLRSCEECEDYEQAAELQKKIEQLKVKDKR